MQHISSGLRSVAAQLLRALPENERVAAAWPHACGSAVAARAKAVFYAYGVLHVALENPEWSELSGLSRAYVARLRELTGVAVENISFEQKRTRT